MLLLRGAQQRCAKIVLAHTFLLGLDCCLIKNSASFETSPQRVLDAGVAGSLLGQNERVLLGKLLKFFLQ